MYAIGESGNNWDDGSSAADPGGIFLQPPPLSIKVRLFLWPKFQKAISAHSQAAFEWKASLDATAVPQPGSFLFVLSF